MATQASETALQPINVPTVPARRKDLQGYLESPDFKKQVQMALPPEVAADMFVRAAATALMRTPDLIKCTQISFFRAALDLASYGLLPNGRDSHLIPFRNNTTCSCAHHRDRHHGRGKCNDCSCRAFDGIYEVQLIIDYKGLVKCVRRSGEVSSIHCDVVYDKDVFSFSFGSHQHLDHTWPEDGNRGKKIRGFYSYVKLRDGSEDFIVMSTSEVEAIRQRSKAKDSGPWVSDFDEMGKKTAFRRHSKWLPFSEKLREVIEQDDEFAGTVGISDALEGAANQHAINASISLADIKPSKEPNRGHDATNEEPEPDRPKGENEGGAFNLKHLGEKNKIPVFNQLPPIDTVTNNQKVYVRAEDGAESLHTFAAEFENADGSQGAWLLSFE